jgi:glycerol-3-phosphate acyltransferase PlsY
LEGQEPYFEACPERALIALAIAALVIYKHRTNIRRLFNGKENKFSFHSTKKEKN